MCSHTAQPNNNVSIQLSTASSSKAYLVVVLLFRQKNMSKVKLTNGKQTKEEHSLWVQCYLSSLEDNDGSWEG